MHSQFLKALTVIKISVEVGASAVRESAGMNSEFLKPPSVIKISVEVGASAA